MRILIVRLSALGDVVMASGLIPALRALYPHAHIGWLTQAAAAPLLAHNPHLDEVLIWPRERWQALWRERRWVTLWREIKAFRARLRSARYDLVLDAQGLLKSGLCAWLTAAPRRIGLLPREGSQWLVHERAIPSPVERDERMGAEYRFLARYLGAPDAAFRADIAVGEAARRKVRQLLASLDVSSAYVALCPFTTRPQKHWFEDDWAALADELRRRGLTPVMLGGPGDAHEAERISRNCPGLINLAGQLRLDESVAVIADAALLVGVDTGLTHLGSALSIPTVALFGSTRPYLDADSPGTRVLYEALPCSPCRRHPTCGGAFHCMRAFTTDRVLVQALSLLGKGS